MTTTPAPTNATTSGPSDVDSFVALVGQLAIASSEATRLAAAVQARLPSILAATARTDTDTDTVEWVRGVAKTPTEIRAQYPRGSGEVWYVVIRGREPGLYRTSEEAAALTHGVPNNYSRRQTSYTGAIQFYSEAYDAARAYRRAVDAGTIVPGTVVDLGVQKWVEAA